jgi:hypothetical protein
MTAKKDLKRRIRERMEKTGEPYSLARREVMADPPPAAPPSAIEVVEMDDITELGAELGFRCTISITHALTAEVAARTVLEKLRDVLIKTPGDPAESARARPSTRFAASCSTAATCAGRGR